MQLRAFFGIHSRLTKKYRAGGIFFEILSSMDARDSPLDDSEEINSRFDRSDEFGINRVRHQLQQIDMETRIYTDV